MIETLAQTPARKETLSAIQLLLRYLEGEGVEYIFGIPGGPLMPLYEALFDRGRIRPILAKHEEGAAFMADGYARVRGGLGVCCATTGPGATNTMTGITCAYGDSIPVLLLTAQVATGAFGKGAVQESTPHGVDLVEMFKPVTKLSSMLISSEKMPELIRLALRAALTGRRGPVHLNLPADLVKREVRTDLRLPERYRPLSASFDREAMREASRLLIEARRPCILLGHGVVMSRAYEEVRRIAERLRIPVATSPKAKGAFPENHKLSLGVFGFAGHPRAEAYLLAQEVDVLMAVGTSLGEFSTHTWDERLRPGRALIHIDIDPREIGKNYPVGVGIVGDARAVLKELDYQIQRDLHWTDRPEREGLLDSMRGQVPRYIKGELLIAEDVPMKPQRLIHEMQRALPDDALLFVDIGNCIAWAVHYYESRRPGTFFLNLGMASMGHAVAAAIGGKLAAPDKPVVAFVGDAAFAMNGMEVHTAVDHDIPVTWVVVNNGGHGMVHHGEKIQFQGRFNSSLFHRPIDVCKVAEGLGALAFRVDTPDSFRQALKRSLDSGRPCVIDARVDPEEAPPMSLRIETLDRFFAGMQK